MKSLGGDESDENRGSHHGGGQSHQDHHGEEGRGDDSESQADVEHDQFHQAAGIHQDAERGGVAPIASGETRGDERAAEFTERRHADDGETEEPIRPAADEIDAGIHSGDGEEGGEQQDGDDIVEFVFEFAGNTAVVGDEGTEEKRSEDGVNADRFGGDGAEQHRDEEDGDGKFGILMAFAPANESQHQRSDEHEHGSQKENGAEGDVVGGVQLGFRHADDQGEQAPGGHIVQCSATEGHHSEVSLSEFSILEDAGEDGKGGDGHGHSLKEGETREGDGGIREAGVEPQGENASQDKREDNTGVRNGDRSAGLLAELESVEFQADEKHIEDDAELGDRLEGGEDTAFGIGPSPGDQEVHGFGGDRTEDRWTKEDSRDDFTDDRRLPETAEDHGEQIAQGDDRCQCDEDVEDDINLGKN